MIAAIQDETRLAVAGMRRGAEQMGESVRLVGEAQESLSRIDERMASTLTHGA